MITVRPSATRTSCVGSSGALKSNALKWRTRKIRCSLLALLLRGYQGVRHAFENDVLWTRMQSQILVCITSERRCLTTAFPAYRENKLRRCRTRFLQSLQETQSSEEWVYWQTLRCILLDILTFSRWDIQKVCSKYTPLWYDMVIMHF